MTNELFEAILNEKSLSQSEKTDKWHNGTRDFNIGAASPEKLRTNLDICQAKGYEGEAAMIKGELNKRGASEDGKRMDEGVGGYEDYDACCYQAKAIIKNMYERYGEKMTKMAFEKVLDL